MKLSVKTWLLSSVFLIISLQSAVKAQVVIGSDDDVEEFVALKIISTSGGLRYPQLTSAQIATLTSTINNSTAALGLMVFNIDGTGSLEYYNGSGNWTNLSQIRGVAKSAQEQTTYFDGDATINVDNISNDNYIKEYSIKNTSSQNIEIKKIGKFLDYENIIKEISVDTQSLPNDVKVNVEFYPKVKELLPPDKKGFITARLYADYIEGGTEKQIEFIIEITR